VHISVHPPPTTRKKVVAESDVDLVARQIISLPEPLEPLLNVGEGMTFKKK
jgi:hypothetical protein